MRPESDIRARLKALHDPTPATYLEVLRGELYRAGNDWSAIYASAIFDAHYGSGHCGMRMPTPAEIALAGAARENAERLWALARRLKPRQVPR